METTSIIESMSIMSTNTTNRCHFALNTNSNIDGDNSPAVAADRWRFAPLFSRSRNATVMNRNAVDQSRHGSLEQLQPWFKKINVEPSIFMYSFIFGLLIPVTSLFLFFARCVEIFADRASDGSYADVHNATLFCMEIQHSNNTEAINEVDADVASMRIFMQMGNTLATLIMAPIIGAWADYGGRRKPLITILIGLEVYVVAQTLGVYFYTRVNVFYFFLTAEIFSGLCGGLASLTTLAMSIVSDDARADRTFTATAVPLRVIIACVCQSMGVFVGTAVTSLVEMMEYKTVDQRQNGYLLIFTTATIMATIAFVYTVTFIKDSYKSVLDMNEQTALVLGLDPIEPSIRKNLIGSIVDSVKGVARVVTMKRPGWNRLCLNFSIVFVLVEFFAYDTQITCLFVKRPPFEWSDSLFSNFMLARFVALSFGMLIVPTVIRKTSLVGKESYMIMIGVAGGIIGNIIFAFSKSTTAIFATIPFSFFGGGIQTGNRTLLPKLVPQEQTARLFSLVAMVLVTAPLISALTLNNIYTKTLDWWPGFVFIIQSIIFSAIFFGQLSVHFLLRPLWQRETIFDGTEALLPNPYDEEEDMTEERMAPFESADEQSDRSISEEAVNSAEDDQNSNRLQK